jgi:small subunit ribosomal protein S13e
MAKKKTKTEKKKIDKKEIEADIISMAKAGETKTKIGQALKTKYGMASVKAVLGKKMNIIFSEHKLKTEIPDDLNNLIKNADALKKHLDKNKQDKKAKRSLLIARSRIIALTKYYKKEGILSKDWHL